jgi:septal ring factor EnvC (AmiA/AmiB activator)
LAKETFVFMLFFLNFCYYNTRKLRRRIMAALQRLQEKIAQWKTDHEALKSENAQLKAELTNVSGSQSEQESQIAALKRELEEKDAEIEKIIAQVEALLA